MRSTIFFLLLFLNAILNAQEHRVIAAKIVDIHTKAPLESVHIGFVGSSIGTITGPSGHFILGYPTRQIGPTDVLRISCMGYETRDVSFQQLKRLSSKPILIPLTRQPFSLGEVVLKCPPREKKTIGHTAFTAASMGYWEGSDAVGGEIASVIEIRSRNTKLLNLAFNVLQNRSDSLLIRVHIYEYDGGEPERSLISEKILHTISRKKGLETISLEKYNILADDDILISIELVAAYGSSIYFSLSASAYGGMSFIRERNRPHWMPQKKVCVGFQVGSSIPIKREKLDLTEIE
jgi:hypothetical protein